MTIALSIKVHDGIVLATDSASTLYSPEHGVFNVYNRADKIFNLYKGRPLGAITWGGGSIGAASISTLMKDLRRRFQGESADHADWGIGEQWTVEGVAIRLREFLYEERYVPQLTATQQKPVMGFLVAGYSNGVDNPEVWRVQVENGECGPPVRIKAQDQAGLDWNGEIEAISRLVIGFDPRLPQLLKTLGVPEQQVGPAIERITEGLRTLVVPPPMPIQDAIRLAEFLVDLSIKWYEFKPGAPTVGGAIEIAAITRHEGFKWVQRKHYFDTRLNPSNVQ